MPTVPLDPIRHLRTPLDSAACGTHPHALDQVVTPGRTHPLLVLPDGPDAPNRLVAASSIA